MKKVLLLLLLICPWLLGGCWDAQELENTQYITAMGIDLESEDKILLSLNLVNTEQLNSTGEPGSSGGSNGAYYLATATGRDLYDAFRNFAKKHSRRGELSHLQAIIIGEKFAQNCMDFCLDWLNRNRQLSSTTSVFLAGGSAYELMRTKPPQEKLAGDYLAELTSVGAAVAMAPKVNVQELLVSLITQGRDAVLPKLERVELDYGERGEGNETLGIDGMGVFRGSYFCDWLSSHQARGYFWLKGGFRDPVVLVLPNRGRWVSVQILDVDAKIKPRIEEKKVRIEVEVFARGEIFEVRGAGAKIDDTFFHRVGQLLAREIQGEIKRTISISQRLESDFLGFGEIVRSGVSGKKWQALNWRQEFPTVPIEVRVRGQIRRSGVALDQIKAW